jgi:hypothetical protein
MERSRAQAVDHRRLHFPMKDLAGRCTMGAPPSGSEEWDARERFQSAPAAREASRQEVCSSWLAGGSEVVRVCKSISSCLTYSPRATSHGSEPMSVGSSGFPGGDRSRQRGGIAMILDAECAAPTCEPRVDIDPHFAGCARSQERPGMGYQQPPVPPIHASRRRYIEWPCHAYGYRSRRQSE